MTTRKVTRETLNDNVEFDCPFIVGAQDDGETIIEDDPDTYAPCVIDYIDRDGSSIGEMDVDDSAWEPVSGYSGQHGYRGPEMHASEFLGGGMARDVLADTGAVYVIVAVTNLPEWEATDEETEDVRNSESGWVLLKLKGSGDE